MELILIPPFRFSVKYMQVCTCFEKLSKFLRGVIGHHAYTAKQTVARHCDPKRLAKRHYTSSRWHNAAQQRVALINRAFSAACHG